MGTAREVDERFPLDDGGAVEVSKYRRSSNIWFEADSGTYPYSALVLLSPGEARRIAKALKAAAKAAEG